MSIDCLYRRSSLFDTSFVPLHSSIPATSKMSASNSDVNAPISPVVDEGKSELVSPTLERLVAPFNCSPSSTPLQDVAGVGSKMSDTLWMGDLEPWMDATFIQQLWASLNEPVNVKVMRSKASSSETLISYCFVQFSSSAAAERALMKYNNTMIPGAHCTFKLNWATGGGIQHNNFVSRDPEFSIFVGDLLPTTEDSDLFMTFRSIYPSCTSAKIIVDPVTGLSRKYGFVRFSSEKEQQHALMHMQGYLCQGRPLRISVASPKSRASIAADSALGIVPTSTSNRQPNQDLCSMDPLNTTVFVGGLASNLSEKDLQVCFQPFGRILNIKIPFGKGCGFVQYSEKSAAEKAINTMQGALVGTSHIRLAWGHNTLPVSALSQSQSQISDEGFDRTLSANQIFGMNQSVIGANSGSSNSSGSSLKSAPVSPRTAAAQSLLPNSVVSSINGMNSVNFSTISPPPLSRSASISPTLSGSGSGLTPLSSHFPSAATGLVGGQVYPQSSVLQSSKINGSAKVQPSVKLPEWLQPFSGNNHNSFATQDLLTRVSSLKLVDDEQPASLNGSAFQARASRPWNLGRERQSSLIDLRHELEQNENGLEKSGFGLNLRGRLPPRSYSTFNCTGQYLQPSLRLSRDS